MTSATGAGAPLHDEGTFTGVGGVSLFHQSWTSSGPGAPRAAVVIVHGLAEHSGRYGAVVDRLLGLGCAVHALDHRGHGRSGGPRADCRRFDDLVDDLERFRVVVRERHPEGPLVLLGHSMGGLVVVAHAVRHPGAADALVLSAPAVAGGARTSWRTVTALRIRARLRPGTLVAGLDAALVARDPVAVEAYRRDPLVHQGPLPVRMRAQTRVAARALAGRVDRITVPVLLLHGEADRLVPVEATRELAGALGSRSLTVRTYPGLYHEVFHDPERDRVLADVTAWLDPLLTEMAATRQA
jgi:alpha-beta hydrolase superfamily lysophospholipase